ncbi:hypothetical protein QQG74_10340 [Micromonospora sp. FIMYZ51]|uniref:hypothetical protein n=1 Tax=Micromonospora sp. FIMYZ51 TaxID=3051832 RepID=UPI00311F447A
MVLAADAPPVEESAIMAFCPRSMPSYMAPSRMRVADALPVNQHGKTDQRRLLAALAGE